MNDYKHFKYSVIRKLNVKEKEANKNCFSQNKKLQIFHLVKNLQNYYFYSNSLVY